MILVYWIIRVGTSVLRSRWMDRLALSRKIALYDLHAFETEFFPTPTAEEGSYEKVGKAKITNVSACVV